MVLSFAACEKKDDSKGGSDAGDGDVDKLEELLGIEEWQEWE